MIGFAVFWNNQGAGYIHKSNEIIYDEIKQVPVTIAGVKINPGEETTLSDHFCRPLKYLGMLDDNEMIFLMGTTGDLFETNYYYQSVHRIADDRIFEMFSPLAGRDFNFINGKWK